MNNNLWHGILLDMEFSDPNFLNQFKIFAKRKSKSNPWTLFGIEVVNNEIENVINTLQQHLKIDKPYYAHFYNDEVVIVIFKEKIFRVSSHASTWTQIIEHGKSLNIPEEQLDFWPNRFQDEIHYFNKEDFV